MTEMRSAYKIFVLKPEGKILLGKQMRRYEDNIKNDLCEIWCGDVDWTHLVRRGISGRLL
jgi:hypothetical protein